MIVVLGAGESGIGAALLAAQMGLDVFVSDRGKIADHFIQELQLHHIPFEEKGHTIEKIRQAREVIKSPGIPPQAEVLKKASEFGIPVIGEIEFAGRYCSGKIIGITGSNGKTTTTNLILHLLTSAGINAVKCGNVGVSFARAVASRISSYYVVELSSFQLEDIVDFHPDIAVITNISPDHLDRYDYDLTRYAAAKFRIGMNQTSEDTLIIGELDAGLEELLYEMAPSPHKIKTGPGRSNLVCIDEEELLKFDTSALRGKHNAQNASCAAAAALAEGIKLEVIKTGIQTFVNDPHRMEEVGIVEGVRYINDSKATNVDAVYFALEAMETPVIWIAGGVDKGNDYSQLYSALKGQVKTLICLGVDNTKLKASFEGRIGEIEEASSMEEALQIAQKKALPGDTVLLSPACASFDLFNNYIHRGEVFSAWVKRLKNE